MLYSIIVPTALSRFGGGVGHIWLDDVECVGDEAELTNCTSLQIGVHNCYHSEDAGVRCDSKNFSSG